MATVKQTLTAGRTHKLPCNGYFFQLLNANASVDINFVVSGATPQTEQHNNIDAGFWFKSPSLLTFVEIKSSIDQDIEYVYSLGQTGYDRSQTLSKLLQGSVILNRDPLAVGTAQVQATTANNDRTRLVFTADAANTGTIYLGGNGITAVNGAIALSAGDTFIDESAAIAEYWAIASSNGQLLRISEA